MLVQISTKFAFTLKKLTFLEGNLINSIMEAPQMKTKELKSSPSLFLCKKRNKINIWKQLINYTNNHFILSNQQEVSYTHWTPTPARMKTSQKRRQLFRRDASG